MLLDSAARRRGSRRSETAPTIVGGADLEVLGFIAVALEILMARKLGRREKAAVGELTTALLLRVSDRLDVLDSLWRTVARGCESWCKLGVGLRPSFSLCILRLASFLRSVKPKSVIRDKVNRTGLCCDGMVHPPHSSPV